MTEIRISVKNTSEDGGTFLTPLYLGFHDGSFDLFNAGEAASAGLESLAEDGAAATLGQERAAADADSQGLVVAGAGGPIATGETTSGTLDVDGVSNGYVSFASMVIPSNDAFIGTDDAIKLFSEDGDFLRERSFVFEGEDVYDAGTEVNTELEAAFLNQTGPNTGDDEGGVVRLHDGFNGSEGNPEGEGDQLILGGTNAAGADITEAADFTRDDAQIAVVHINTVVERTGTRDNDTIRGQGDDDLVEAGGGRDVIATGRGWDEIDAGNGRDLVRAGRGDDIVEGGGGTDRLFGGRGDDHFVYAEGDGADRLLDFGRGDDRLSIEVEGIETFDDLVATATDNRAGLTFDFGGGDSVFLRGADLDDVDAGDFAFV